MDTGKLCKKIAKETSYFSGKHLLLPDFLSLIITFRCNFRCKMCEIWKTQRHEELEISAWQRIVEDIAGYFPKETFIEINGGEPLLRKDLTLFLISELKSAGYGTTLNTNGSLIGEDVALELAQAGLDCAKISLYDLDDDIHDGVRGFPGAAKKAKRAISLLQDSAIRTEVGILVTARNIKNVRSFVEKYLREKNTVSLILQPLDEPINTGQKVISEENSISASLWPKKEDVLDLFSWLNREKPANIKNSPANLSAIEKYYLDPESALKRRCFAGQHSCVISPKGEMSLCFKRKSVGNVQGSGIAKLLGSKESSSERCSIRKCKKYCRMMGCNFSRTLPEILGLQ